MELRDLKGRGPWNREPLALTANSHNFLHLGHDIKAVCDGCVWLLCLAVAVFHPNSRNRSLLRANALQFSSHFCDNRERRSSTGMRFISRLNRRHDGDLPWVLNTYKCRCLLFVAVSFLCWCAGGFGNGRRPQKKSLNQEAGVKKVTLRKAFSLYYAESPASSTTVSSSYLI